VPQRVSRLALIGLGIGSLAIGFANEAEAQPDGDLKGKTVTIIIAFGAGGGYDQYGRLFARHIGRHIPGNPTVIPSNMPGANGTAVEIGCRTSVGR
jgi:tripartite-type tricarboxylate transporter receptor subunit TctC